MRNAVCQKMIHKDITVLCRRAKENREKYWEEVAEKLVWTKRWTTVMDDSNSPFTNWFVGGELNLCYNCLDQKVIDGHGDTTALILDSPVTKTRREYSYSEILDQVSKLAGVLTGLGVGKGDVVMIYMPMIVEGAYAMLASARIASIHVAVPSGLPAFDLALRIDHSKPKVILAASYGYHAGGWKNYMTEINEAYEKSQHKPEHIIVLQRTFMDPVELVPGRDLDWTEQVATAKPVPCVPMEANEPLFMVYTSGSTGVPKAIVHAVGRFAVRLTHDCPLAYGSHETGEVLFGTSSFGWIAGHFFVIYTPLLSRIPSVVFEGDPLLTSDVRTVYRVLSTNNVTRCIIRPGVLKLLKGMDPEGKVASEFNLRSVKHVFTGGERTDMNTMQWVTKTFNAPLWNGWGQSELSSLVVGVPDDSAPRISVHDYGFVSPGIDMVLLKHDGTEAQANELGRILIRLPLPPGGLLTIYGSDELCKKNYFEEFPGFYDTKDEGYLNEKGHMKVESRVDDIMKVGQIYLSAQAVEEVILSHKAVAECVVVSTTDLIWKEIPVALYMKKTDGDHDPQTTAKELEELVMNKFGESVKYGGSILVKELPRTRTGKVHRPSCNALARGQEVKATGAVENAHVFPDIEQALKAANYGKNVLLE